MSKAVATRLVDVLYAVNAVAAAAAAVVLATAPRAIPAAVGLVTGPSANMLAYLLAAAELAIAAMCLLAFRSPDRAVHVQTVTVLTIFHVGSAAAGLATATAAGTTPILWNVLARALIVIALLAASRLALRR